MPNALKLAANHDANGEDEIMHDYSCAASKAGTWNGNDPVECGWPMCGCDPKAERVIESLREQGALLDGDERECHPAELISAAWQWGHDCAIAGYHSADEAGNPKTERQRRLTAALAYGLGAELAKAMEARRAETGTGSAVGESPAPQGFAETQALTTQEKPS